MTQARRRSLRARAGGACEYCRLPEAFASLRFQQDHVVAIKHSGETSLENLAWSCAECNRHKGSDLASIDKATGNLVRLFNPRTDVWQDHFEWQGPLLLGKTSIGRVTIALLQINRVDRVALRRYLMDAGVFFP